MGKFKVGDIVVMTEKTHIVYRRVKDLYGKITIIYPSDGTNGITWYTDPFCTIKAKMTTHTFYDYRIALALPPDPKELARTPVERKCRKLWNNSKWVKENPHLAY